MSKSKKVQPRAKLPVTLVRRATAAASAKKARLLREARELIALVKRRKKAVTEAFYDIGEACARLKEKAMVAVLGRSSFAQVCEKDLGFAVTTANRLIDIVRSMTRDQALAMGQQKALAMATLAEATPERDTPASLFRKKSVAVAGGGVIAPRTASAREVERAAREIRQHANASKPRRGRSTTQDERQLADLLERQLRRLGLERARVTAVATKPGQGADLRIERIPAARLDVLRKAIGA